MTTASAGQAAITSYLEAQFIGPKSGDAEVLESNPIYAYLTGMLFPVERLVPPGEAESSRDELMAEPTVADADIPRMDPPASYGGAEDTGGLSVATGWVPSAMGLSCIPDAPKIVITAAAARYEAVGDLSSATKDELGQARSGADKPWRRIELESQSVEVALGSSGHRDLWNERARLQWRSRPHRDHSILTVALSNLAEVDHGRAKREAEYVLFQCELSVEVAGGSIHPYPPATIVNASAEDRELAFRYRNHPSFAVGHGVGTTWSGSPSITRVATAALPREVVPPVQVREGDGPTLRMAWLGDETIKTSDLTSALRATFSDYNAWIAERSREADAEANETDRETATAIVARAAGAATRIETGIALLENDSQALLAFRIANQAMHMQALRTDQPDPAWRPFQLAFILMTLRSAADPNDHDRSVVDLLWFPTGGGKTEAYLGLAAFELVRRRLDRGYEGGGTAVITRYTMRLLTAQQFQRTARLICALELLHDSHSSLRRTPRFSIGLLLGNETTPPTFKRALEQLNEVRAQQTPENPFQIRACPWCGTSLVPPRRSARDAAYGFEATSRAFRVRCVDPECAFHSGLPVQVVDEAIFADPPSIVVATVDKFARLAWTPLGGSIFGLDGVPFDPPSLVIQDELHLISGPLGTIVGIYEAAIRALLKWRGRPPKVVASTATIRSSSEQVQGLMASTVEVFPPAGLDADDSYFATVDRGVPGRLYLGLMPQAFAPAWSIGQASATLLSAVDVASLSDDERDAYWTLVMYHNSLRELGRSVTILRDDVRDNLERLSNASPMRRTVSADGVVELTSNVKSHELVEVLERLAVPATMPNAIDAVVATNILSVGIDVSRLGLMLVNGQPKTTSEYIQATSRVGRDKVRGIVVTLYRSGKARDRSTFEAFSNYHSSFYRFVEPTSVTPWALQARRRAARAALVILMRHGVGLNDNTDASRFDPGSKGVEKALRLLGEHIATADPRETEDVLAELRKAVLDWHSLAATAPEPLKYENRLEPAARLLKNFGDSGPGWPTMHSMRSVDRTVRIRPTGETV